MQSRDWGRNPRQAGNYGHDGTRVGDAETGRVADRSRKPQRRGLTRQGGPHGARLYYRYRGSTGRYDDLPVGTFDESGKRGLTLSQARERIRQLRERYLSGERDLRASMEADGRDRQRKREAEERAEEAAKVKAAATLGALLSGYVAQLRRDKKPSARAVERTLHNHVRDEWPIMVGTRRADHGGRPLGRRGARRQCRKAA